jgi:molecular chaperone HscB
MPAQTEQFVVTCWNCGKTPEEVHFCANCESLQPPVSDYFSYLGVPRKLSIDRAKLEKNFYMLSRRLHPDVYFRRPVRERQFSVDATALLNDAYRTLKDPVSRVEYLLGLYGIKKREESSAGAPPELLEEVFELNMALEEIRHGDASVRPQLEAAKTKFEGMLAEADRQMEELFGEWDRTSERRVLEQMNGVLQRRKYIQNLLRDVNEAVTSD